MRDFRSAIETIQDLPAGESVAGYWKLFTIGKCNHAMGDFASASRYFEEAFAYPVEKALHLRAALYVGLSQLSLNGSVSEFLLPVANASSVNDYGDYPSWAALALSELELRSKKYKASEGFARQSLQLGSKKSVVGELAQERIIQCMHQRDATADEILHECDLLTTQCRERSVSDAKLLRASIRILFGRYEEAIIELTAMLGDGGSPTEIFRIHMYLAACFSLTGNSVMEDLHIKEAKQLDPAIQAFRDPWYLGRWRWFRPVRKLTRFVRS